MVVDQESKLFHPETAILWEIECYFRKLQVYLSRDPCGAKQCLLKRLSHYLPDCQRLLDDIAYYIDIIIYSIYILIDIYI